MTAAARWGAACFAVAAPLFVLYPLTRPWHDEATATGAVAAMGSPWWLASHTFAMAGFVLVALGLFCLRELLVTTPAQRTAGAAMIAGWIGTGLALPYYGAETFGLHTMALTDVPDPVTFSETFRQGTVAMSMFGLGLALLAGAGILAAVAIARSNSLPRSSGTVAALGLVLFLPQFFAPPGLRIAHGVLLGLGLLWMALILARAGRSAGRPTRTGHGR